MTRKIIFLFLALALPVLIFLFLKKFGKNEFALPVFHEYGIDSVNTPCGTHYRDPYRIADTVLRQSGWKGKDASLFIVKKQSGANDELRQILQNFSAKEIQVVDLDSIVGDESRKARWSTCVFILPGSRNTVLIDHDKRIRGYYTLGSREEIDRLNLELEILLKHY